MTPLLRRKRDEPGGSGAAREAYAAVAYPGYSFPRTHPGNLGALAALYGLEPAPVATARVLELGCGDGGNLIPIAHSLPGSECVGVDLSPPAIARGRELASALGVTNVALRAGDLTELDTAALGRFDYVIAHGVYSWVPHAARDGLLAACAACLRGDGVAYVSYNALPGDRLRAIARDAMRRATRGVDDPAERVARARAALNRLVHSLPKGDPARAVLEPQLRRVLERGDAGVFHDDLADENHAVHFADFVDHAERHGLRYLTASDVSFTALGDAGSRHAALLDAFAGDDEVEREQQLDFARLTAFRETLLVRGRAKRATAPVPGGVDGLHVSGAVRSDRVKGALERFRSPSGATAEFDHPAVKQAFARIGEAWPAPVAVPDLLGAGAGPVRQALVGGWAAGMVGLSAHAAPIASRAGERPLASPLARAELALGRAGVTNLRHEHVRPGDELAAALLGLLDGTRDRAQLTVALRDLGSGKNIARQLDETLGRLAELALLVRES